MKIHTSHHIRPFLISGIRPDTGISVISDNWPNIITITTGFSGIKPDIPVLYKVYIIGGYTKPVIRQSYSWLVAILIRYPTWFWIQTLHLHIRRLIFAKISKFLNYVIWFSVDSSLIDCLLRPFHLSNSLIFVSVFRSMKFDDYFQFPWVLDMGPYTAEGIIAEGSGPRADHSVLYYTSFLRSVLKKHLSCIQS